MNESNKKLINNWVYALFFFTIFREYHLYAGLGLYGHIETMMIELLRILPVLSILYLMFKFKSERDEERSKNNE